MKKIFKFLLYLLFFILSILSAFLAYYYFDQTICKGKITILTNDLSAPVHIHTDEYGFVHIKANTRKDAFFAIGVTHARDRLFAIDVFRRVARGRLSEIIGEKGLEIDKITRTVGFGRIAENDVKQLKLQKDYQEVNEIL